MFEITEYLQNIYKAVKERNIEQLEEIWTFVETDDQEDYETRDFREIEYAINKYISSKNDQDREKAMILIDEFDTSHKIDRHSADY